MRQMTHSSRLSIEQVRRQTLFNCQNIHILESVTSVGTVFGTEPVAGTPGFRMMSLFMYVRGYTRVWLFLPDCGEARGATSFVVVCLFVCMLNIQQFFLFYYPFILPATSFAFGIRNLRKIIFRQPSQEVSEPG